MVYGPEPPVQLRIKPCGVVLIETVIWPPPLGVTITGTGLERNVSNVSSIHAAVREFVPSGAPCHVNSYGLVMDSPIFVAPLKNSTLVMIRVVGPI